MNTHQFSAAATNAIDAFGTTAHSAIDAYRKGGERLAQLADHQWKRAFREAGPKLTPETRKNAAHAQKVFGGYYARGLDLSAGGAATAVDTAVKAAATAVERAAAFTQYRKTA
ncbi:MAG: hypothetical protein ABI919_04410 [Ramlibacter sp.]